MALTNTGEIVALFVGVKVILSNTCEASYGIKLCIFFIIRVREIHLHCLIAWVSCGSVGRVLDL